MLRRKTFLIIILHLYFFSAQFVYAQIKNRVNSYVDQQVSEQQSQQQKLDEMQKRIDLLQDSINVLLTSEQTNQNRIDSIQSLVIPLQIQAQELEDELSQQNKADAMALAAATGPIDSIAFQQRQIDLKLDIPLNPSYTEEDWSKHFFITHNNVNKKKYKLESGYQTFGWHPYWMGDAYKSYNFSLLSMVAYYGYEINPNNGNYRSVHEWSSTTLIDSAKVYGTKVLLNASLYGRNNIETFLSSISSQRNFISTIFTKIQERGGDGITLNFEDVPPSLKDRYTTFIIDLSTKLKKANPDLVVTVSLPAFDLNQVYDFPQIVNYVDLFVSMSYDFYGSNSFVAGPIAPIGSGDIWWENNVERVIDEYMAAGISPKKLLLGVPYYGAEWQTQDLTFPSRVERFIKYPKFRDIKQTYGQLDCCEEILSQSKFHVFRDNSNNYRQIWYEDSVSLGKKYELVKSKGIGGIGIWALGYDNGYTDLWDVMAQKFTPPPEKNAGGKTLSKSTMRRIMGLARRAIMNPASLITNPRSLLALFGIQIGSFMILFFIFRRFNCKWSAIPNLLLKLGMVLLVLGFIACLIIFAKVANWSQVGFLFGGFLIAGIIFFIFSRRFLLQKDLP